MHRPSEGEADPNVKLHLSLAMVTALALAGVLSCACGPAGTVTNAITPESSSPVAAPTGRTATRPVQTGAYLGVMAGPWVGPDIRPRVFLLGADRGLGHLRWIRWTETSAYGYGVYSACANATSGCTKYRAAVSLTNVRKRDGKPYFDTMKIIGTGHQPLLLIMGSFGFWADSG
jgi:hypothetical protein